MRASHLRFGTGGPVRGVDDPNSPGLETVNFLAHALLSPDDDEIRAGNVCADLIKGRIEGVTPSGIVTGVALHRAIDRFADRHHAFRACFACVAAPRRRYAAVIVDIFFDHCLARCWADYSTVSLGIFVEHVCVQLEGLADVIPVRDRARLDRMLESRWLHLYATRDGLDRVFAGLALPCSQKEGWTRGFEPASLAAWHSLRSAAPCATRRQFRVSRRSCRGSGSTAGPLWADGSARSSPSSMYAGALDSPAA